MAPTAAPIPYLELTLLVAAMSAIFVGFRLANAARRLAAFSERQATDTRALLAAFADRVAGDGEPNMILIARSDSLELVNLGRFPAYIASIAIDRGGRRRLKQAVLYVAAPGETRETVGKVLPPAASARLGGLLSTGFVETGPNCLEIAFLYGGRGAKPYILSAEVVSQPGRGVRVTRQGLMDAAAQGALSVTS